MSLERRGFATWESPASYLFIDPLVRDDLDPAAWEPFDRAVSESGRLAAVLLTAPWHERSVRAVAARYDAAVWLHPRGRARVADLPVMRTLPPGVEVFAPDGVDEGQVAFHIVPEKTLVVAEFFVGTKSGVDVLPSPGTEDMAAFAASLEHLRNLEIERVLVAHGPRCSPKARAPYVLRWTPSQKSVSSEQRRLDQRAGMSPDPEGQPTA
jgi:glyoxylase-like metal-dependent hydrolase (beta-lactamase superfamily II)